MTAVVGGLLLIVAVALVVLALVATIIGGVDLRKELVRLAKQVRPKQKQQQDDEGLDKAA
ncbi:hypothetical protein ABN028_02440 [Actinopolymorpha sp. B17G11]|uniref:hypothetical protein n=1 Tax=unclassified Actinopolymorpha TaxID=2627063 RepID=UPI0032E500FA